MAQTRTWGWLMVLLTAATAADAGPDAASPAAPLPAEVRLSNGHWPPWFGRDLPGHGVASQIVTDAFAEVGIAVDYEFLPWSRALELARAGELDGTVCWSHTAERAEHFHFSAPVFEGQDVFFHRRGEGVTWTTLRDLQGQRIGVTLSYSYGAEFDAAVDAGILDVDTAPSDELNLQKLLHGRIDLFPMNMVVGLQLANQLFTPAERAKLGFNPQPIRRTQYHVLFPRSKPRSAALAAAFDRGLAALHRTGRPEGSIRQLRERSVAAFEGQRAR